MCYVDKVSFGFCISQKLVGLWKTGFPPPPTKKNGLSLESGGGSTR